jgi:hypothetical protein
MKSLVSVTGTMLSVTKTMVTVTQMLLSVAGPVLVRTERITWAQTQCGTR